MSCCFKIDSIAYEFAKWCILKAFLETTSRVQARVLLPSKPSVLDVAHVRARHRMMHKIVFVLVRNRFGHVRGVDVDERMFFVEVVGDDYGEFAAKDLVST